MGHEFILASGNLHKAQELSCYLAPAITVQEASQSLKVVEDGSSFEANSYKKAQAYFEYFGHPTIADDSGLVVEALPNELGIHSARFGGEGLSDRERAEKLLEKLAGHPNRNAFFICYLCFYLSEKETFFFEGRLVGTIARQCSGDAGFGYDPVFIPQKGKGNFTLAQRPEWKDEYSHRAQACRAAKAFFESMASLPPL